MIVINELISVHVSQRELNSVLDAFLFYLVFGVLSED